MEDIGRLLDINNKLTIQFGYFYIPSAANNGQTLTFPTSFNNTNYSIVCTNTTNGTFFTGNPITTTHNSRTKSTIHIGVYNGSVLYLSYIAIGT